MAVTAYLGADFSVDARFFRDGQAVVLQSPVRWVLYSSSDEPLINGTATPVSVGVYRATLTVPTDYALSNNVFEDMTLEVYGKDALNAVRSAEFAINVRQAADDYVTDGVIVYTETPVTDSLVLNGVPTSTTLSIKNAAGAVVYPETVIASVDVLPVLSPNAEPDFHLDTRKANIQHKATYSIDTLALAESTQPYNAVYKVTIGGVVQTHIRQFIWVNDLMLGQVAQLRSVLDKARLIEIDPTVQWYDEELAMCLYTGLRTINGYQPIVTNWRFTDLPQSLYGHWQTASAIAALEMRLLAEGLNTFEFSGLNTQLNYNRTEALSQRLDALNGKLESNLPTAKKTAARAEGSGTVDLTVSKANIGQAVVKLGLTYGPTNNIRSTTTRSRRRFFGSY